MNLLLIFGKYTQKCRKYIAIIVHIAQENITPYFKLLIANEEV